MGTVKRAIQIVRVLTYYLVVYKLTRHRKQRLGWRLREAFQELGTAFIKIGQILSLRYDLLGKKDCDELYKLLDSVPAFDNNLAREIFEHDLGISPDEAFATFSTEPLSSASVAQVYDATLQDGTRVAVKIRRPWIGILIEKDIAIFRALTKFVSYLSPTLRRAKFAEAVDEINVALLNEIDLRNEAEHLRLFSRQLRETKYTRKGIGKIVVPELYEEYCSYNVLTMTFIEGIPLLSWKQSDKKKGYDALASVNTIFSIHVVWLFRDEDFILHGDLHPANMIVMENGNMGLIDFGIIGYGSGETGKKVNDTFFSIYMKDVQGAVAGAFALANIEPNQKATKKIYSQMESFIEKAHKGNVAYWFIGLVDILFHYRCTLPLDLALIARGQIMFDGVIHMIDPSKKTTEFIGPEFEYGIKQRIIRNLKGINYVPVLYVLSEKFKESPQVFNKLIERYADDPLLFFKDIRGEQSC